MSNMRIINRKSPTMILGLILGLIFSIKILRYIFPIKGYYGHLHIILVLLFALIVILNINRLINNSLDLVATLLIVSVMFTWIINNYDNWNVALYLTYFFNEI